MIRSGNLTGLENMNECMTIHAKTKQKQVILQEMKKQGLRITNQRSLVIDIILSNECTCCKEIYYQANRIDPTIGIATVYRMVKTLEEIGMIDRKNLYKISCDKAWIPLDGVELELANKERVTMKPEDVKSALELWLSSQGMNGKKKITRVYQCVQS